MKDTKDINQTILEAMQQDLFSSPDVQKIETSSSGLSKDKKSGELKISHRYNSIEDYEASKKV